MKFAPNMAENSGARLGAPTVREGLAASTRSSASGDDPSLVAAGPRQGSSRAETSHEEPNSRHEAIESGVILLAGRNASISSIRAATLPPEILTNPLASRRNSPPRFTAAKSDDLSGLLYSLIRENGLECWGGGCRFHPVAGSGRRHLGPRIRRHGIDQVEHPAGCGPRTAGGGCGGRARLRRESPGQQQREHRNDQNCGRALHFVLHLIRRMTNQSTLTSSCKILVSSFPSPTARGQ